MHVCAERSWTVEQNTATRCQHASQRTTLRIADSPCIPPLVHVMFNSISLIFDSEGRAFSFCLASYALCIEKTQISSLGIIGLSLKHLWAPSSIKEEDLFVFWWTLNRHPGRRGRQLSWNEQTHCTHDTLVQVCVRICCIHALRRGNAEHVPQGGKERHSGSIHRHSLQQRDPQAPIQAQKAVVTNYRRAGAANGRGP